ncbi:MAG: hypothetical protein NTW19_06205 [Planctomycetota bacterium]|nr:hypothetical protein [Planctomycetota bacterium]
MPRQSIRIRMSVASIALACALISAPAHAEEKPATAPATQPAIPPGPPPAGALQNFTRDFPNAAWMRGSAEAIDYDIVVSTKERDPKKYVAHVVIDKQFADAVTRTRAADPAVPGLRPVLTYRLTADVLADAPTDDKPQHLSLLCYVGQSDLKSLKIDMTRDTPAGPAFKQWVNHKGTLDWHEFVPAPGQGLRDGKAAPPVDMAFLDTLPLVLRGLPFGKPVDLRLPVLAGQAEAKLTSIEPVVMRVVSTGKAETITVGTSQMQAYRVDLFAPEEADAKAAPTAEPNAEPRPSHRFWFAAQPEMENVMVRHIGPDGAETTLKSYTH